MTIELSGKVEDQLRDLAVKQGRAVGAIVEDAVREYLEASAITDMDAADIAETQLALVGELPELPEWK